MFLAFVCVLILVGVTLLGGDLARLTELRLRNSRWLFAALALQIAITAFPHAAGKAVLSAIHIASYVLAAVFVWQNRRVRGLALLALGAGCNLLAISANGGELPASASALRAAGQPVGSGFANSGVVAHPHLGWLGDIVATPAFLPFRNVISIGDMLILLGAAVLVGSAAGAPRLARLAGFARRNQSVVGESPEAPAPSSHPSGPASASASAGPQERAA